MDTDCSVTDLAYMAGLIDSEGSISLIHDHPERGGRGIYAQVGMTSTDREVLDWMSSIFGGSVHTELPGKNPLTKKIAYRWNLTHHRACTFLTMILPYMRIKKGQTELAVALQNSKHGGERPNDEQWVEQKQAQATVRMLNLGAPSTSN